MCPTLRTIPPDVAEFIDREGGVLVAARARAAGITGGRLSRLVRVRLLTRVGFGQYVATETYEVADTRGRHRLEARAFALSRERDTYLTGWSGAVTWELPVIGPPPTLRRRSGPPTLVTTVQALRSGTS